MAEPWDIVTDAYRPGAVTLEPALYFLYPLGREPDPFSILPQQRLAELPPKGVTAEHTTHSPEDADHKGYREIKQPH